MTVRMLQGHALDVLRTLPAASAHSVCTSPPYWQLRDYGTPPQRWPDGRIGEWGQEPEPERYVAHTVAVFREVRRVLRDDGTLWLNLGDTYWNDPGGQQGAGGQVGAKAKEANRRLGRRRRATGATHAVLKRKDLVGIPWRVAFALQADGWYLRSEIIWAKENPLPESVRDRPTKAHEALFLLAKRPAYFYDAAAIAEPKSRSTHPRGNGPTATSLLEGGATDETPPNRQLLHRIRQAASSSAAATALVERRNRRSVWSIPLVGYGGAHYAAYPPALVEPCIRAGTSEWGCCPRCGASWRRVPERRRTAEPSPERGDDWRPACVCPPDAPVPCTVLDPCAGAGTTGLVADRLGRDAVLIELQPEYAALARQRVAGDAPLFAEVASGATGEVAG